MTRELFPRPEQYHTNKLICGHLNRSSYKPDIEQYLFHRRNQMLRVKALARACQCPCSNAFKVRKSEIQKIYEQIGERRELSRKL
jgi:hypothetical protein